MLHIQEVKAAPTELLGVKVHQYLTDYETNLRYQD